MPPIGWFVPPARLRVLSSFLSTSHAFCRVLSRFIDQLRVPSESIYARGNLGIVVLVGPIERENSNFVRFGLSRSSVNGLRVAHPLVWQKEKEAPCNVLLSTFRCLHNAKNLIKPGSSRGKKRVTELIAA